MNQAVTTRLEKVVSRITRGRVVLKDRQRQSLEQALIYNNLIISVPTGSGKSLIYTYLPLAFELYNNDSFENYNALRKSIIIVIYPLIQLINDQVGYMEEKYGVKAHFVTPFSNPTAAAELSSVLSNRNNNDAIQVLTITPETFASKEFQSWYKHFEARNRSQHNRFLEVIALDEVHSILSCSDDFRSEYAEIISYIGVNVPIVMLSGSLTIKYEIELLKRIESRCNDSLDLIRLPMNMGEYL